ncbi:MAG: preprotein translocase subunit SecE [Candidatus Shapirobacteria bacterium]|nr:preprotein translocase subunit SecE [Candidatus Shapirobacteria bacterium]
MVNIGKFLIEAQNELKRVVWPTKREIINLTVVVIIISLVVGLFLTGSDFIFSRLIRLIIGY